jgi:hypothetical protein
MMRITVDIDASTLREIQRLTGIGKKSPAVSRVVDDYLREARKRRLIRKVMEGGVDYGATNEDLESGAAYDSH